MWCDARKPACDAQLLSKSHFYLPFPQLLNSTGLFNSIFSSHSLTRWVQEPVNDRGTLCRSYFGACRHEQRGHCWRTWNFFLEYFYPHSRESHYLVQCSARLFFSCGSSETPGPGRALATMIPRYMRTCFSVEARHFFYLRWRIVETSKPLQTLQLGLLILSRIEHNVWNFIDPTDVHALLLP